MATDLRPCADCAFVYGSLPDGDVARSIVKEAALLEHALRASGIDVLGCRLEPQRWSALEYGCHVRDVLLVQRDRVIVALVERCPSFARMWREERVELCHYASEARDTVCAELAMSAQLCASVFEGLSETALARRFVYNWPERQEHDLAWLAQHTYHEAHHHRLDVEAELNELSQRGQTST